MTILYGLGFNPIWYIADNVGRPLGGGSMYTYRSLAKTTLKYVYQDPDGLNPWPNPVLFNENGQQGPFYFAVDSTDPQESYYIEIYDAAGNLVWNIDDYLPPSGSGGGGGTSVFNVNNLVINGVFWRNTGNTASPIANTYTVLAPGCHAGLALTASNAGPDIVFLKNNLTATDQITFTNVLPGTQPLNGDVAPVQVLNYICGIAGTGETQKCIQIPITAKIQNLTNVSVTVTLWAMATTATSIVLQWLQFLGDGVALNTPVPIATQVLSTNFTKYTFTSVVPDITPFTLGGCGNDGLFLQIQMPLGQTCNITLTEPSIFIGSQVPPNSFINYDQIDGILNVPRTGDIRANYSLTIPPGWIAMNDGSIGSASSGATTRPNQDTFPLYNLIYTTVSRTYAPIIGTDLGTSVDNFIGNRPLAVPKTLGRAFASLGTPSVGGTNWALGQIAGAEGVTLIANNLPAHIHALSGQILSSSPVASGSGGTGIASQGSAFTGNNTTTNTPVSVLQPTGFQNYIIKL